MGWAAHEGGTTGGTGGSEITVDNMADLNAALKETGKRIIWLKGTLTGRADVPNGDKSILGLPGAKIVGGMDITGPSSKPFSNIIVRNFEIEGPGANDVNGVDALNIQNVSHIWVDHMYIHDGLDGNMDISNSADLVTVSWTKWEYLKGGNHAFCNLIGSSDSRITDRGKLRVTMQYNWWSAGVVERMPRVRFGQVHVVNSLFDSQAGSYCLRAGLEANILAQANAFIGVKNPIDLFEKNFTAVTMKDNLFVQVVGDTLGSGKAFTPPYNLPVIPALQVEALVKDVRKGAGPNLVWDGSVVSLSKKQANRGLDKNKKAQRISSGLLHQTRLRSVQGRYLRVIPDSDLNSTK
jgi:pectate lyase